MTARSCHKAWWCLLLVAFFAPLIWFAVQRNSDIKAVENAIDRDWELVFDQTGAPPAALPSFVDSAAKKWFDWRYADSFGYDGYEPVKTRNRADVYHERFRCLFRGPIEEIIIGYPEKFRGDALGAALARFPRLRYFCVEELDEKGLTESDWTLLCRRLRDLPQLEEVELGGPTLTNAALAPLAGHPKLRIVTIQDGRFTHECARTFSAIPHLTKLSIEGQSSEGNTWLAPDDEKTMRARLPGVFLEVSGQ
jgi:hypothetical protein